MKCEQVQPLLVAYLDKQVSNSERSLIQMHLSECSTCRDEMALRAAAQRQIRSVLQRRAAHAAPSPEAWGKLEARLAKDARPSSGMTMRLSRLAPSASRAPTLFAGGVTMRKRMIVAATVAVLALTLVGVWILRGAAPVSAQQILERSSAAQEAAEAAPGIRHMRSQKYVNMQGTPKGGLMDGTLIIESYQDLQTGKQRLVVTAGENGRVIEAWAYDGNYVYSSKSSPGDAIGGLTIYRTPQPPGAPDLRPIKRSVDLPDAKRLFEKAKQDSNAHVVGQATWSDGRRVYVLRLEQLGKALANPKQPATDLPTTSTLYFDTGTYQLLGQEETVESNGKQTVVSSFRQLVQETLPSSTPVAWDLHDLKGVTTVDDPDAEHGDQLPVAISHQELVQRTKSAYMLRTLPEGFTVTITALPKPKPSEPDFYMVDYRDANENAFHIQSGTEIPKAMIQNVQEVYTTRSGLTLYFQGEEPRNSATVRAPDGTTFIITANMPRERVKAFAEDLVPVR